MWTRWLPKEPRVNGTQERRWPPALQRSSRRSSIDGFAQSSCFLSHKTTQYSITSESESSICQQLPKPIIFLSKKKDTLHTAYLNTVSVCLDKTKLALNTLKQLAKLTSSSFSSRTRLWHSTNVFLLCLLKPLFVAMLGQDMLLTTLLSLGNGTPRSSHMFCFMFSTIRDSDGHKRSVKKSIIQPQAREEQLPTEVAQNRSNTIGSRYAFDD